MVGEASSHLITMTMFYVDSLDSQCSPYHPLKLTLELSEQSTAKLNFNWNPRTSHYSNIYMRDVMDDKSLRPPKSWNTKTFLYLCLETKLSYDSFLWRWCGHNFASFCFGKQWGCFNGASRVKLATSFLIFLLWFGNLREKS